MGARNEVAAKKLTSTIHVGGNLEIFRASEATDGSSQIGVGLISELLSQ